MKMRTPAQRSRPAAAFTLVEVMVTVTIVAIVLASTLNAFLFGLRMMYKDNQRLMTNTTLKYFMAQVAKNTLDASEFYIYPDYKTLGGSMDSQADLTTAVTDSWGIDLYHGDCLVLVTRTSLETGSNIRQLCIYYRTAPDTNSEGEIRYYEGADYGASGSTSTLNQLLNAINLKNTPKYPGTRVLASRALGRPKKDDPTQRYPIFSSKAPQLSTENESVSINAEVINGTSSGNLLSSSSFNYTISPRR